MTEGERKDCGQCKTPLVHVKIIDTFNGNVEKLQWQNVEDSKPHFKFAGPGKWNCVMPQITTTTAQETVQETVQVKPNAIEVKDPFQEAELITRWARERAYKMVMVEVSDYSKLTQQEKNSLGQKEGMLTRCLVDVTLKLMEMHGVKSNYGAGS